MMGFRNDTRPDLRMLVEDDLGLWVSKNQSAPPKTVTIHIAARTCQLTFLSGF